MYDLQFSHLHFTIMKNRIILYINILLYIISSTDSCAPPWEGLGEVGVFDLQYKQTT